LQEYYIANCQSPIADLSLSGGSVKGLGNPQLAIGNRQLEMKNGGP
jgi:hypothetical protein